MTEVTLHGRLAEYGGPYSLAARDTAEVVRGLTCQLPGFREALAHGHYRVLRGGAELGEDELGLAYGGDTTIDIIPVAAGAKDGTSKIIIGGALITAAVLSGGMAAGATGLLATTAHAGMMMGMSMALQGVSSMLTSTPNAQYENKTAKTKTDQYFNGPSNSAGPGLGIPIVIGRLLVGSVQVSASISAEKN